MIVYLKALQLLTTSHVLGAKCVVELCSKKLLSRVIELGIAMSFDKFRS